MSERGESQAGGIFDHEAADEASVEEAPPPEVEAERPSEDAQPRELEAAEPQPALGVAPAAEPPAVAAAQPEPEPPPSPPPGHGAGELAIPPGMRVFGGPPNGSRRSVGIAVSKFNGVITSRLLDGALAELSAAGVVPEAIEIMPVPGAFELPLAAMALAKSRRYSCVLALGCVIRGETPHFDYVSSEAASGVQLAGLETGVPVSFGVLTCDTLAQAEARAGGRQGNKGVEAARSALEMVESLGQLRQTMTA